MDPTMTKEPIAVESERRRQLEARRARLAELEAERDEVRAKIVRTRDALARALADGAGGADVRDARPKVADLEAERNGLEAAIGLVRAEVEALEGEVETLHVTALRAEADRLRGEARDAWLELRAAFQKTAVAFVDRYDATLAARGAYHAALGAVARANGGDSRDVRAAKGDRGDLPEVGPDWPEDSAWVFVADELAAQGRKGSSQ